MGGVKTKATSNSVTEFLNSVEDDQKRRDSFEILEMMEEITGEKAVMWGTSIVGFGKYHYKSKRSSQEGDWPLAGFSPRKQYLTIYAMEGNENNQDLLDKLGTHKTSKACLYIKRLSDVDLNILKKIIQHSYNYAKKTTYDKNNYL